MREIEVIAHFDVDGSFAPFFREKKFPFSLSADNLGRVNDADKITVATVKSNSKIDAELLRKLPSLKAIITRTVGANHIDLEACKKSGIEVMHIPDYGAFAIGEHVFALLLSQTRKILPLCEETRQGKFSWTGGQGFTLKDKVLGVIGIGKTGKETVKIAKGFQMKVIGYDKYIDEEFARNYDMTYVPLKKLLVTSDVISVNIPLLKETFHLIGKEEIALMKPNVVLVNVSRGEIIDTQALADNLEKFRYVCLDVLEDEENYNLNNPVIKKLAESEKVCITPHIAFFTDLTTHEIARITNQNISFFKKDDDTNRLV